jgi:hypothetical protein
MAFKRPRTESVLNREMFLDPWISEYSTIMDKCLRSTLCSHLSSATREAVESRAANGVREQNSYLEGVEEVTISF